MEYLDDGQISAIRLCVEFGKAFGSFEWSFIKETLQALNFRSSILQWNQTDWNNTNSYIITNGSASECFCLKRGVRKGCHLSQYLFIIRAEVLLRFIRKEDSIKVQQIGDTIHKIRQYEYDTCLFLVWYGFHRFNPSNIWTVPMYFWFRGKLKKIYIYYLWVHWKVQF